MAVQGVQQLKQSSLFNVRLTLRTLLVVLFATSLMSISLGYAVFRGVQQDPLARTTLPATAPIQEPITREDLLAAVNAERTAVGVAPLQLDERLNQSAQKVADSFVLDATPHVTNGTRGTDLAHEYAPNCKVTSENISWHHESLSAAISGWKGSPSHYAALVDSRYQLSGFGIAPGNVLVQHFCAL